MSKGDLRLESPLPCRSAAGGALASVEKDLLATAFGNGLGFNGVEVSTFIFVYSRQLLGLAAATIQSRR